MKEQEGVIFSVKDDRLWNVQVPRDNCPSRINVPEGIEEIGDRAFQNCREVEEIVLPKSLKKIGYDAFAFCKKLTTLEIPEGVSEIGGYAFSSCTSLRELKLPNSIRLLDPNAFTWTKTLNILIPQDNGYYAFQDGMLFTRDKKELLRCVHREKESITVPDGVESIGKGAFFNCEGLTQVYLPSSLTCIKAEAFKWCNSLLEIEIPCSVTVFGEGVFESCTKLTHVTLPRNLTEISARMFRQCRKLNDILLPEKIQTIQKDAFRDCTSLISIKICSKEIEILENAFNNCTGLKEISLPQRTRLIGNGAFCGCTSLANVHGDFTNTVYFGHRAFNQTPWLSQLKRSTDGPVCLDGILLSSPAQDQEKVIIPKTVRMIAGGAFHGKKALKSVVIPSNVQIIGPNAFSACRNLVSVSLTTGLKQIERNAFRRCSELRTICIPDSVESIGDYAFLGCTRLTRIELYGRRIDFGKAVFRKPWREIWTQEISRKELEDLQTIETTAFCLPAHLAIKTFGVGAVLGFCRSSLSGTVFSEEDKNIYEQYLKRNSKIICESPNKYGIAVEYLMSI